MTDNDQDQPTAEPADQPEHPPTVAGMLVASGDLAVVPGPNSDQEAREDQ